MKMKKLQEEASAALTFTQEVMKKQYDKHKHAAIVYKPGIWVWLESINIQTDRPSRKLDDKWHGPFQIIEKVGQAAYKLKLPRAWKAIHPVFNEVLLTLVMESEFPNQRKIKQKVLVIPDAIAPTVEEILESRHHRGGVQYLIKWSGKPHVEATWHTWSELIKQNWDLIGKFHADHPEAPKPVIIWVLPQQVREVQTQKESNFTPEWGYWGRKFQNWQKHDNKCQMIIALNSISELEDQTRWSIMSVIDLPPIKESWISTSDQVTHVAKVGILIKTPDNWQYPILSLHKVVTPFTPTILYEPNHNLTHHIITIY